MARYAVGDIQGCFAEFAALLQQVQFNPACDQLFSVGDLVNRGPQSLEVLRWMYQHRRAVHLVLGNHDLHLLAVSVGVAKAKPQDTLAAVLHAADKAVLLGWLRQQPLFAVFDHFCLVHAGVWPGWSIDQVQRLAKEVEHALQADNGRAFFQSLYGDSPNVWTASLSGAERLRFIVNTMTRMRALSDPERRLDFKLKGPPADFPTGFAPWYTFPQHPDIPRIICGHWSALGLRLTEQVWSLDTGCVWGNTLTMVNCDNGQVFQQSRLPPLS